MRNPFYFFRKNQKILLAIFGVMLMIAFTVGSAMMQFVPQPGVGEEQDRVVAKVGDEAIRERRLNAMRSNFTLAMNVIAEAMRNTYILQGQPNPPIPPLPGIGYQPASEQMPPQIQVQPINSAAMIQIYAAIKEAKRMGIVVDDDAVRHFLSHTTGDRLTQYDYNAILEDFQRGDRGGLTYDNFFELVRDALTYQKLVALFEPRSLMVTPASAWIAQRDLNRIVTAEMVPFSVEPFKEKVPAPSDADLRKYFAKYRYDYPSPDIARPGFIESRKVAVQYIRGDIEEFLERAMAEVTAEEIQAYYNENLDSFRRPQLPPEEPETDSPEMTEEPAPSDETPAPESEQPESDSPESETPMPEPEAETEPQPETPPQPETASPDEPAAEESTPAEPSSEQPAPEEPSEPQSRRLPFDAEVQLVGFQDDEQPAPPAEEEPAPSEPDTPEPAESEPETVEQPMTEETPAEPAETPADSNDEQPAPEQPSAEDQPSGEAPLPEYRDLEEVEDQIRRTLAQPRAQRNLERALQAIREPLQQDYEEFTYADPDTRGDSPFDMDQVKKIAEELGLTVGEMPLSDQFEASMLPLGEVSTSVFNPNTGRRMQLSLLEEIFESQAPNYQVRTFPPMEPGQRIGEEVYLFWKTGEAESYVPNFEQAKERVTEAWIRAEAIKLAKAEAKKLSEQVTDAESLQRIATELGAEVNVAENVTYYNQFAFQFMGPTLGGIPGIDDRELTNETLDAVFAAAVGQSFVAPTRGYETFYIGLITEEAESSEELRKDLLTGIQQELPQRVRGVIGMGTGAAARALDRDFRDKLDIKWEISPEQLVGD